MGLVKQKIVELAERGKPGTERACDELAAALENEDTAVRREAAREMVRCPNAGKTLVNRLKREAHVSVREAILNTLLHLNDPSAVSDLVDCLRSEDAALRNEVIDVFRQMGGEIDSTLHSLLTDPDPDIRIFAVNILDSQQHADAERWLIQVIDKDTHVNVCAAAVDLLCEVGTAASSGPLAALKTRFASEPYIQFASDLALKRIGEA